MPLTEPESDVEVPPQTQTQHSSPPNLKRKSIYSSPEISSAPIKRARFETAEDEDSVTESESELDEEHAALLARARNPGGAKAGRGKYYILLLLTGVLPHLQYFTLLDAGSNAEDSVTESESDIDDEV